MNRNLRIDLRLRKKRKSSIDIRVLLLTHVILWAKIHLRVPALLQGALPLDLSYLSSTMTM
jgi:hypothetical protein